MQFHCFLKKPFPPFLHTKPFFAMKIAIHYDKHLHHRRTEINTFFNLGLGYHQIQSVRLEFLKRCGTQIRVNTLTGSFSI